MEKQARFWSVLGCVMAGLGVCIGAFGAHSLQTAVEEWYAPAEAAQALQTWEVGVRYQMYHALGILLMGMLLSNQQTSVGSARFRNWACYCFLAGTAIFSGLLYAIVLTGISRLGMIVPLGGLLLIAGWVLAAVGAFKVSFHSKQV